MYWRRRQDRLAISVEATAVLANFGALSGIEIGAIATFVDAMVVIDNWKHIQAGEMYLPVIGDGTEHKYGLISGVSTIAIEGSGVLHNSGGIYGWHLCEDDTDELHSVLIPLTPSDYAVINNEMCGVRCVTVNYDTSSEAWISQPSVAGTIMRLDHTAAEFARGSLTNASDPALHDVSGGGGINTKALNEIIHTERSGSTNVSIHVGELSTSRADAGTGAAPESTVTLAIGRGASDGSGFNYQCAAAWFGRQRVDGDAFNVLTFRTALNTMLATLNIDVAS